MFLAGDVMGRSQNGNNNGYCQDNETTWVNWSLDEQGEAFKAFTQRLIQLRHQHPLFGRRRFFQGRPIRGSGVKDILWLKPDGQEMTDEEWGQAYARCLGMFLSGEGLDERDERNRPIKDDTFLVLTNAHHEAIPFQLPATAEAMEWLSVLDTVQTDGGPGTARFRAGQSYPLEGRSLALLMQVPVVPAVVPG
jgi:glycogen operon protein